MWHCSSATSTFEKARKADEIRWNKIWWPKSGMMKSGMNDLVEPVRIFPPVDTDEIDSDDGNDGNEDSHDDEGVADGQEEDAGADFDEHVNLRLLYCNIRCSWQ